MPHGPARDGPTVKARTTIAWLALSVGLTGALSACGSDEVSPDTTGDGSSVGPDSEGSQTPTPAPTELAFGDAQTVAWQPTDDLSAAVSIRVETVREARGSDFEGLAAAGITEDNQPYYADVVITNEGDADLGGLDVPLYLADSNGTLTPPSKFAEPFEPCPSGPLPASFGPGAEASLCLVFVASPGADFESITVLPGSDAGEVTWTGDVAMPAKRPPKKGQ